MSVDMNTIKVGPVGGQEGTVWEEKGKGQIAKIFISYDVHSVCSLQFLFVENGNFVLSDRHGAAHNKNFTTVVLDYPSEFLTWISGSYHGTGLRSIKFGTNKDNNYGLYRSDINNPRSVSRYTEFKFEIGNDRSFGGFYGTKTDHAIESIGVYVKPSTSSMITSTDSRVKVKREEED